MAYYYILRQECTLMLNSKYVGNMHEHSGSQLKLTIKIDATIRAEKVKAIMSHTFSFVLSASSSFIFWITGAMRMSDRV